MQTTSITKTNILDFRNMHKLDQVLDQAIRRFKKQNQSAIVALLQQAKEMLDRSKDGIQGLQSQQAGGQGANNALFDLEQFKVVLEQAINMAFTIPSLSGNATICVEDLQQYSNDFIQN